LEGRHGIYLARVDPLGICRGNAYGSCDSSEHSSERREANGHYTPPTPEKPNIRVSLTAFHAFSTEFFDISPARPTQLAVRLGRVLLNDAEFLEQRMALKFVLRCELDDFEIDGGLI
jgi:hypothetical protein